jgi:putative redox protein
MRCRVTEPVTVGGTGLGPSPHDILCAALGACTVMTVRVYAAHKKWPLAHLRVEVTHRRRQDATPVDLFSRRIALAGELDAEQRARLLEIAERCPVHRTLTQGAAIETSLENPAA